MDNKIVEDMAQRIPEGASLHDSAEDIEFIAAVRRGLTELDRGERISIGEVGCELLMDYQVVLSPSARADLRDIVANLIT